MRKLEATFLRTQVIQQNKKKKKYINEFIANVNVEDAFIQTINNS